MGSSSAQAVYHPRRPRESPLFPLIERYFPDFERSYSDRFEKTFGPWRAIIGESVRRFLRCGDLHYGFARVRCCGTACGHEMFVPFSCRQRCLCASCHQIRASVMADHLAHDICLPVPHRQFVWTIPKRLRVMLRQDRALLGRLAPLAWETILEGFRYQLQRADVLPGMVAGIQTIGDLAHFHPHIHAIVTDGRFALEGTFLQLPPGGAEQILRLILRLWENQVFDLLLREGKIDQSEVDQMRSWPHSGSQRRRERLLAGRGRVGPGAAGPVHCPLPVQPGSHCAGDRERLSRLPEREDGLPSFSRIGQPGLAGRAA